MAEAAKGLWKRLGKGYWIAAGVVSLGATVVLFVNDQLRHRRPFVIAVALAALSVIALITAYLDAAADLSRVTAERDALQVVQDERERRAGRRLRVGELIGEAIKAERHMRALFANAKTPADEIDAADPLFEWHNSVLDFINKELGPGYLGSFIEATAGMTPQLQLGTHVRDVEMWMPLLRAELAWLKNLWERLPDE